MYKYLKQEGLVWACEIKKAVEAIGLDQVYFHTHLQNACLNENDRDILGGTNDNAYKIYSYTGFTVSMNSKMSL